MKHPTERHQTGLHLTRPCGAKARPASPNCHVRSAQFWDITQCQLTISYQHWGTTHQPHLKMSRNPKERRQHD